MDPKTKNKIPISRPNPELFDEYAKEFYSKVDTGFKEGEVYYWEGGLRDQLLKEYKGCFVAVRGKKYVVGKELEIFMKEVKATFPKQSYYFDFVGNEEQSVFVGRVTINSSPSLKCECNVLVRCLEIDDIKPEFQIDTGSDVTTITSEVAEQIGLYTLGITPKLISVSDPFTSFQCCQYIENCLLYFPDYNGFHFYPVIGKYNLIGMDILQNLILILDTRNKGKQLKQDTSTYYNDIAGKCIVISESIQDIQSGYVDLIGAEGKEEFETKETVVEESKANQELKSADGKEEEDSKNKN